MRRTSTAIVWVTGILLVLAGGCNSQNDTAPIKGVSGEDADRLNAGRAKFETTEDPPFSVKTHFAAGQLAESQGAPMRAMEQYRSALRMDAKHLPSLFRLAVLYAQSKQYPDAIEAWEKYIKLTGGDAGGYANLGVTHEMAGNVREAEEAYQKGLARDAANAACHVNYGLLLARQRRIAEAEQHLSAVLPPAQVRYNLGSIYEQQGQIERARREYQQAIDLDPELKEARTRLTTLGR